MYLSTNARGIASNRCDHCVPTQCIESFTEIRQIMVDLNDVELATVRQLTSVTPTAGADCMAVHDEDMPIRVEGFRNLSPKRLEPFHWYVGQPKSCEDKVVRVGQIEVEDIRSNPGDAWVVDSFDA